MGETQYRGFKVSKLRTRYYIYAGRYRWKSPHRTIEDAKRRIDLQHKLYPEKMIIHVEMGDEHWVASIEAGTDTVADQGDTMIESITNCITAYQSLIHCRITQSEDDQS